MWRVGTFDGHRCGCGCGAAFQTRLTWIESLMFLVGAWKRFNFAGVLAITAALGGEAGAHSRNLDSKLKESSDVQLEPDPAR